MKKSGLIALALLSVSVAAVDGTSSAAAVRANAVVQVRDIPNAPVIAIVAWTPGQGDYGLRTRIGRDGTHLGHSRKGEHRLYLDSKFAENQGGFAHASVNGKVLRSTGSERDMDACRFGECSPQSTVGVGVSDEILRENKDKFVVQFRPRGERPWEVTVRADLIEAYLAAVDSVTASVKK